MDWVMHITYWCAFLIVAVFWLKAEHGRDIERKKNRELRQENARLCGVRLDELKQDETRRHACEIEADELKARLKAANLIADGWRTAAEKGRAK